MESIRLPVFLVISAHAQTLDTRPFSPLPLRGLGTRLDHNLSVNDVTQSYGQLLSITYIHVSPNLSENLLPVLKMRSKSFCCSKMVKFYN